MSCENTLASLADTLGDLRSRIKSLREEEATLRRAILNARPNGAVTGGTFTVQVRVRTSRRFDVKRLPDHIRNDPTYWTESEVRTVTTKSAVASSMQTSKSSPTEEFDVFEPF